MYGKIYRKWKRLLAEFWTSHLTLAEYCRQHNLNPKSAGRWKNINLHRSFDGLPGAVQQYLREDPLSGHMFVFFNRTFKIVKILYWDGDGYAIWSKRLIRGMFHLPPDEEGKITLDARELQAILYGIRRKCQNSCFMKRMDDRNQKINRYFPFFCRYATRKQRLF